jgi:hypothetical protein
MLNHLAHTTVELDSRNIEKGAKYINHNDGFNMYL